MTHDKGNVRVVVVEFDETLREALYDLLSQADHNVVTEMADETAALAALTVATEGVVTVVSNRDADHHLSAAFFAAVVADQRLATHHQYLMLSTNPAGMPPGLQTDLARLRATILGKPFDIDVLLAAVRDAAARLVSQASTAPAPRARRPRR